MTYSPGSVANDPANQSRRRTVRGFISFVWAFLAAVLVIGAWSVSTPLGAAPDEPSHMVEASAAVRGQFNGHQLPSYVDGVRAGKIGTVEVPEYVARVFALPVCFALKPNVPANCSPAVGDSTKSVTTESQFTNYPPLYYFLVGIPTLLSTGSGALYGMQYMAAILDSLLVALGLFLLVRFHPRRLTFLGAMVALSPMVLFVSAVVSSSGMETAAAFASWCGGLCIVERTVVPRSLAVLTAIPFVVLILSRPLSPINAAVMIAVLALLMGWERSRALIGDRSMRPIWISALIATLLAGLTLIVAGIPTLLGAPAKPRLSLFGSLWLTLRLTGYRLRQCVGDFGWLDTPVSQTVIVIWTSAVIGLAAYGLAVSRGLRRALPLLVLSLLALPLIFESPQIDTVGPYWQGRYWLPLAVGIPLIASSVAYKRASRRSVVISQPLRLVGFTGMGVILALTQISAFMTALHRYQTGLGAKVDAPTRWTPPGGTVLVVSLFVAGQTLLVGFLCWAYFDTKRQQPIAFDQPARQRT